MTEFHPPSDPSRPGATGAGAIDPTGAGDPQLAEGYAALAHLLAASAAPVDPAALSLRIMARLDERAHSRRRVRWTAAGLAMAASIALLVGVWMWMPHGDGNAVVALNSGGMKTGTSTPAAAAHDIVPAPDTVATSTAEGATGDSGSDDDKHTVPAWDDELAVEIAEVASQAELVECRWREAPDDIAQLRSQVDDFSQDINGSESATGTNEE